MSRIAIVALLLLLPVFPRLQAVSQPNLVVLIVAEQFRADYLDRYRPAFSADGFNRLLSQGSSFRLCRYDHLTTLAAPNAATLATGAYPELHGIVANRWYDRQAKRLVGAVEGSVSTDDSSEAPEVSPSRLAGSTLADELRLASAGGSRVFAVSGESAPAVLLAGRSPAGCYWMGPDGGFETSSSYQTRLPAWVKEFNALHSVLRYEGQAWKSLEAGEAASPLRVLRAGSPGSLSGFLPLYRSSPFAAQETLAFARQAIEKERLGRGGFTDLVIINLSAPALLGLETGAYSPLMRDMVVRLDRMLGDFLNWLDDALGLEKTLVVFSGVHGLPPAAEDVRARGLPAGLLSGEEIAEAMNKALAERMGPDVFVEKYVYPFVYLNQRAREGFRGELQKAIEAAGEAAVRLPGVAAYYAPHGGSVPATLRERLGRSWHGSRSGDLMLVYEPFFVERYGEGRGTASGSLYRYDTDVPLVFLGPQFQARRFHVEVDATSIAPTLAAVLGIPAPSSATGPVLAEALAKPASLPQPPEGTTPKTKDAP